MKYKKHEEALQIAVCRYLAYQYPHVIFNCDVGSGIYFKNKGWGVKAAKMRSSRGYPDLFIAEPKKSFNGLFIEIKTEKVKIYLKDGLTLVADKHIREQAQMLSHLKERGYAAEFGIGFEQSVKIIKDYLGK